MASKMDVDLPAGKKEIEFHPVSSEMTNDTSVNSQTSAH